MAVQQRRLRLMRCKTLLNMLDDGIDIAESDPFFCRQFQLPAIPMVS